MAVLSLPLSFTNSFWSQDYRRGLEVLFAKLEQGSAENDEITAFIRARAIAEGQIAVSLTNPMLLGPPGTGFSADDGASLLMAFRGLQSESAAQGEAHKAVANELNTLVADPFDEWAQGYKERLKQSKSTVVDNWLRSYELAQGEVRKLKHQYLTKTRRADEAEDDAKFAPHSDVGDKYTTSPRLNPRDPRTPPQRTASVSERIAQRLKEIQRKSAGTTSTVSSVVTEEPKSLDSNDGESDTEEKLLAKVDKGKGKAVDEQPVLPVIASPPPMSPPLPPSKFDILPSSPMPPPPPSPMLLAGLSLPPSAISSLLARASEQLPLRPVRFPLLGEYPDCFTGEEFVAWLNENVQGFGGSLDRAEDAARDLTEREGLLRRIGEFGNQFEPSDDAFYQFRPKAFDLEGKSHDGPSVTSPTKGALAPVADNLLKRSGTFVNLVSKALTVNGSGEPAYIRARHEAEAADKTYRVAVRKLDRQRLGLEERIEEVLKTLQRWEVERLRAVKTVLLQYQGTLANLPRGLEAANERSATLIAAYSPDSDLSALIERYRTGPFRPAPQVYESVAHDESDVVFGIDLRKWAEGGWSVMTGGEEKKDVVPSVVSAMLNGLTEAYGRLQNDDEKRKAWIYEVPLPAVHHLREALNGVPLEQPIPADVLSKYDAPVIAATVKLWALELDPPLALWEGWDDIRRLYPTVGAAAKAEADGQVSEEQHIQDLSVALQRLPRVHLFVLDAIVNHLKTLIDSTTVKEPNEVYITKLALSVGRSIIRPRFETEITIQDRHPTLLFIDLIKNYADILPPTIARKKRESERKIPLRKRTAPVDMRLSRSKITVGTDHRELLAAQQAAALAKKPEAAPPVLSLSSTEVPAATAKPQTPILPEPTLEPVPTAEAVPSPPKPKTPEPAPAPILPPATPLATDPDAAPPRPSFKEPPPEDDDLPPRPTFKEPPPEDDSPSPPPMPKFAEPPFEPVSLPVANVSVTPPTPQAKAVKRESFQRSGSPSPSPLRRMSRSPSPASEEQVLSSARASIVRAGSGQTQVRGPRISRGPRAPGGGGSVSSIVSTLNRNTSPPASPSYKRLSGTSSRPTSMVGRSGALSRRTMASDAEDEVVEK